MTYSGHPAACAAALANIALMEDEDICGHVQVEGVRFAEALKALEDLPIVGEVRGSHFMQGIEFVRDQASKEPLADEASSCVTRPRKSRWPTRPTSAGGSPHTRRRVA
jgi:adenosylmethionine-8-amino-7-oxononanoate aminotransferase